MPFRRSTSAAAVTMSTPPAPGPRMRPWPAPTAWTSTATRAGSPRRRPGGCWAPGGPHACCDARTGSARLAAELGCASADLLTAVGDEEIAALGAAGVAAVLCPGAMEDAQRPPVRALLDRGVAVALGSDHSPGGSGITSMSLVIALAVANLGMSVTEALRAATVGGAHALRTPDRGVMARGKLADIVAWDADHEGAFAWAYGLRPLQVWRSGEPLSG